MIEIGSIWQYGNRRKLRGNGDHYLRLRVLGKEPYKDTFLYRYVWLDTPHVAYHITEEKFQQCFHQPASKPKNFFSRIVSRVRQSFSTALTSFSEKRGKPKGF